jgi:hypothetical protein
MSDRYHWLAEILRKAQGRTDSDTGQDIDVGYEVMQLRADLNDACALVVSAGLATGHADSAAQLVAEVLDQVADMRAEIDRLQKIIKTASSDYIDIVFTAPPGPGDECVFVEAENTRGESIRVGEWVERTDGFWALRIPSKHAEIERLTAERDFDRAHIESLQNKIAQASAEVVALEDEVERLKWLEKTTNRAGHLSIAMQEIERLQQKRNEIIEMCAKVCERVIGHYFEYLNLGESENATAVECAAAIRALKEER